MRELETFLFALLVFALMTVLVVGIFSALYVAWLLSGYLVSGIVMRVFVSIGIIVLIEDFSTGSGDEYE